MGPRPQRLRCLAIPKRAVQATYRCRPGALREGLEPLPLFVANPRLGVQQRRRPARVAAKPLADAGHCASWWSNYQQESTARPARKLRAVRPTNAFFVQSVAWKAR